jgi:hypothetical protein
MLDVLHLRIKVYAWCINGPRRDVLSASSALLCNLGGWDASRWMERNAFQWRELHKGSA